MKETFRAGNFWNERRTAMTERSFTALILVSAITLAAPAFAPRSAHDLATAEALLEASLSPATLQLHATTFAHDLVSVFEDSGYTVSTGELIALSGGLDGGAPLFAAAPLLPLPANHAAVDANVAS
jgi:hypothetical protein